MSAGPRAIDISALIALITALIYAAGWSYAYHWYDRFELGLIGLGIPSPYHLMYGFWVLESFWWLGLLVALLLAAALFAWDKVAPLLITAAPVWVPLTFVLTYLLGGVAAGWDYADHRASGFQRLCWGSLAFTPAYELLQQLALRRQPPPRRCLAGDPPRVDPQRGRQAERSALLGALRPDRGAIGPSAGARGEPRHRQAPMLGFTLVHPSLRAHGGVTADAAVLP